MAAIVVSDKFSRPNDSTAYTTGDLVANSTTATSVSSLVFNVGTFSAGSLMVRKLVLRKSGTSVTSASFRLHLYSSDPTTPGGTTGLGAGIANGDNGAWSTRDAGWMGSLDVTIDKAFTDGAKGEGTPTLGTEIVLTLPAGQTTFWGLLEARAAYTPAALEYFNPILEILPL